mmetsp:Transcript_50631/g.158196  ORF Transcript_50631/g.158196 Transcript_50631/m.158196 type:complete len:206 (+) Transcript_50631:177-794(+)
MGGAEKQEEAEGPVERSRSSLEVDDATKFSSIQRGSSDQAAIDIRFLHQLVNSVWSDGPTVEDAGVLSSLLVVHLGEPLTDKLMHVLCSIRIAGQSSTDSPDRLVCDGDSLHLLLGDSLEVLGELGSADGLVELGLVLLLGLTDAEHGVQALIEDLSCLAVDGSIIVLEDDASLAVAGQNVLSSSALDHAGRHSAGESSFLLEED